MPWSLSSTSSSVCNETFVKTIFVDNIHLAKYRGSISAEHGIGAMKTHALQYSKSAVSIALMRKIKDLFDPNGIMNPGKVLE